VVELLEEQRHDLDQAADATATSDQHDHQEVVGLDLLVTVLWFAMLSSPLPQACAGDGGNRRVFGLAAAMVIRTCCRP
jgi:hypothetical protein